MDNGELTVVDETSTTPSFTQDMAYIVDVKSAAAAQKNFGELVEALLDKDTDYQEISGKNAKKKSAWRKLARAFNISDEIVNEELIFDENDNQIVSARYKVRATLPNGRSTIGVGVCSIYDKIRYTSTAKHQADTETPSHFILRGRFSHAEHDIPSTAHTRAKNRAIADLIGAGEVSAEELGEFEEPKKVSRTPRNGGNSNNGTKENSNSKTSKTPRRRNRRKAEPKINDEEIIETKKVEEDVGDNSDNSNSFDELAEKNPALKKAIQRIKEGGDTLSNASIIDELYALYDIGDISIEEYYEAKEVLNI